jgi:purine-binding chemotaxis protein CheW
MNTALETRQYCTFTLGSLQLGLEVERVQEVMRGQPLTLVPRAPRAVRGLMNLRGQIVTAIDLRCRLGFDPVTDPTQAMQVVVMRPDGAISLLVDNIGDVIELPVDCIVAPPPNLDPRYRSLVRGVAPLERGLLLLLDIASAAALV